jgi:hypothetical protein
MRYESTFRERAIEIVSEVMADGGTATDARRAIYERTGTLPSVTTIATWVKSRRMSHATNSEDDRGVRAGDC